MKWRKRHKKKKKPHMSWLFPDIDVFRLVMWPALSLPRRTAGRVTDGWPPASPSVSCAFYFFRSITLTGSTTDSPLGGAALGENHPNNTRKAPLSSRGLPGRALEPSDTVCVTPTHSAAQACGILYSYWTNTHTHYMHSQLLSPVTCQVKHTTLCHPPPVSHKRQVFIVS